MDQSIRHCTNTKQKYCLIVLYVENLEQNCPLACPISKNIFSAATTFAFTFDILYEYNTNVNSPF